MNDRSFLRVGALAGFVIAISAWLAVIVYFALVPAAQQLPVTDVEAYLASLAESPTGSFLFNGLVAINAFGALVGTVAVYYRVRQAGEAWSFFAVLVGAISAAGWLTSSLYQVSNLGYIVSIYSEDTVETARAAFSAPSPVNPFNLMTGGLVAVWFLVIALLMLRTNLPKLLAYLGLVDFADLTVGFIAALAGSAGLSTITALIAGAVGGPIFWLWFGILLWQGTSAEESGSPSA